MARIVPKLNLNRTPELVDNNSLIFAKNIRFNANGLSSDLGFDRIDSYKDGTGPLAPTINEITAGQKIVGVIPYNTSFYVFIYEEANQDIEARSFIKKYDEEEGWSICNCNWNWSGGKIDGICTINLNGDILLTITEYDVPDGKLVPIKTINLNESKVTDDETIYTQIPKVPFINLRETSKYKNTIPAGVYQFFVRYEIRKDFYTDWFPASKELFAGCKKQLRTNQGGVSYIDTSIDSDSSFVLTIEKIINVKKFKSFQLGFIISHDDDIYARAYKHYNLDTSTIYFDYDTEYIEEIDVRDILQSPYGLYNVGNVTSFRNKLYISNYTEFDANPILDVFAQSIGIEFDIAANRTSNIFAGREIDVETHSDAQIITGIHDTTLEGDSVKSINDIATTLINNAKLWIEQDEAIDNLSDHNLEELYGITLDSYKVFRKLNFPNPDEDPVSVPAEDYISPDVYDSSNTGEYDTLPNIIDRYKYHLTIEGTPDLIKYSTLDDAIAAILNHIDSIKAVTGEIGKLDNNLFTKYSRFQIVYYTPKNIDSNTVWFKRLISFSFSVNKDDIALNYEHTNEYSLIPYQKYNFYVHLVKDNGQATNGYLIPGSGIEVPELLDANNNIPAIYPKFIFHSNIPEGYVACFISIMHVGNKVAHVFNIDNPSYTWHDSDDNHAVGDESYYMGSCLELDASLYPWLNNIPFVRTLQGQRQENVLDYRASGDTDFLLTFGGAGECVFQNSASGISYGFIVMPYTANPEYIQSIKCTPFIVYNLTNNSNIDTNSDGTNDAYLYDDYTALNLPGYLCRVKKPQRLINLQTYVSGTDFYEKQVSKDTSDVFQIKVTPKQAGDWLTLYDSVEYTIYSNFNLNYIGLIENYVPRITSKEIKNNEETSTEYYTLIAKDSSILSGVYKLPSMYYNYTRKLYYPFDTYNVLTVFNNTIRSSSLEGDEAKVNLFKFNTTDYYNVPTDKGKIVNLVAVGDNILVHTQDSIYKFSGQNSLTAAGGEDIQMKESEVFDTGIQELFGSEFGYAGLASKEHQILSEFGYTFWDKDSGRIYLYTGNAQMKVLSDDISKLLRYKPITNIYLADDYYNNRIFVCIHFNNAEIATLSYDFVAKSFISLHDFKFDWHFKTKTKCYFVRGTSVYNEIYRVGTSIGSYLALSFNDTLYPTHGENKDCIVDVIYNDNFEVIKTLNVLSWVCNKIIGFKNQLNMAEETFNNESIELRYKGNELTIYTDSCATNGINIENRSNDALLNKRNSYEQVRYNLGKWTFNYFRNILNRVDTPVGSRPFTQDDTLIYGKYIVARFVFNRDIDFKFEDVTFTVNNDNNI